MIVGCFLGVYRGSLGRCCEKTCGFFFEEEKTAKGKCLKLHMFVLDRCFLRSIGILR